MLNGRAFAAPFGRGSGGAVVNRDRGKRRVLTFAMRERQLSTGAQDRILPHISSEGTAV